MLKELSSIDGHMESGSCVGSRMRCNIKAIRIGVCVCSQILLARIRLDVGLSCCVPVIILIISGPVWSLLKCVERWVFLPAFLILSPDWVLKLGLLWYPIPMSTRFNCLHHFFHCLFYKFESLYKIP